MWKANKLWQAVLALTLTFMLGINLRVLKNGGLIEDGEDDNCMRPLVVSITGDVKVQKVNVSKNYLEWVTVKPQHVKRIGYIREKKSFMTIGIPSIKRLNGMTYLMGTLDSFIEKTSTKDKLEVVVVVFLADFDTEYNNGIIKKLQEKYSDYINMGFIQVVQSSREYYPKLDELKHNFNDKEERVKWRAKQVADYAFLFMVTHNISRYYLQVEDDIICAKNFVMLIKDYIGKQRNGWAMLEFSELGFIGKLFKNEDIPKLASFMMTFYQEQPIDWLMTYFRLAMTQDRVIMRKPTLFQHVGLKSSFDTSHDNKLTDRFFDAGDSELMSDDPPARIISNMEPFQFHTVDLTYAAGGGFFWAKSPKEGDTIDLVFDEPQQLDRVMVKSIGDQQHRNDYIRNATVEVSPKLLKADWSGNGTVTCSNYVPIGYLNNGVMDMKALREVLYRKTECLRVRILQSQDEWAMIQQIAVFVQ